MVKIAIRQSFIQRRRYVFTTSALVGSGLATALGGLALAGGGTAAAMAMGGGSKGSSAIPSLPKLPDAPVAAAATEAEKARIRKKSKTILTSPLKGDEFGTGPTLLG